MTGPHITLGIGRTRPVGKLVSIDKLSELVETLANHAGPETWWSGSQYTDNHRQGMRWREQYIIGIDADYRDENGAHVDMPWPLMRRVRRALIDAPCAASHLTPRGARLIFVLDRPVSSKDDCRLVWREVAAASRSWSWPLGLVVDNRCDDFARFFWTPNATVKGQRRRARIVRGTYPTVDVDDMLERIAIAEEKVEFRVAHDSSDNRAKAYLRSAIEREVKSLEATKEGGRNSELYRAACALHSLARGEDLDHEREGIDAALTGAATRSGLTPWEIASTVQSARAWVDNTDQRREVPPPPVSVPPTETKVKWKSAADRALALGGETVRMKTGLPSVDKATRGGIPVGRRIVVSGPPGVGKTTLSVQMVMNMLADGAAVGILAADEEADGLLIRVGQMLGFDRKRLEDGVQEERQALHDAIVALPLILVDADEADGATIDAVSKELVSYRGAKNSVLLVDSIQTARTDLEPEGEGTRMRIDAMVTALKRASNKDGHLVVSTSEVSRGAYRGGKDGKINPLAASKESSSIEYGAAVMLVLSSLPNDVVEVTVPKNRLGEKPTFTLAINPDRACFSEFKDDSPKKDSEVADWTEKEFKIRKAIAHAHKPFTSATQIWLRVDGNKQRCFQVIKAMIEDGVIIVDPSSGEMSIRSGEDTPLPDLPPDYTPDPDKLF